MSRSTKALYSSLASVLEEIHGKRIEKISDILREQCRPKKHVTNYVDQHKSTAMKVKYTDILREERARLGDNKTSPKAQERVDEGNVLDQPAVTHSEGSIREKLQAMTAKVGLIEGFKGDKDESRLFKAHINHPIPDEAKLPRILPFESPSNSRLLRVGVLGPANAGKSTFMNRMLGRKVSITSDKAQTTREAVLGIDTRDNTQFVFYDTPGLAPPGMRLQRSVAVAPWQALHEVDCLLFFWNVQRMNYQLPHVRHYLQLVDKLVQREAVTTTEERPRLDIPTFLVINQIDAINLDKKRPKILELQQLIMDEFKFVRHAYLISALTGQGVSSLMHEGLMPLATPRPWLYSPKQRSLMSDVQIVQETVREKLYRALRLEVPYLLQQASRTSLFGSAFDS